MDGERHAKVLGSGRFVCLQFGGEWLFEAGFSARAEVEIEVIEPGRMLLTRVDLKGPIPTQVPFVWIPVEKLAAIEAGHVAA
jgi:hypothetical protein